MAAYLTNKGMAKDVVTLKVKNGHTMSCLLEAQGEGSSILFEPDLAGDLHLGQIFTHTPFYYPIKLTNLGIKDHTILWSVFKPCKSMALDPPNSSILEFKPNLFKLSPNQSIVVNVECNCSDERNICETFYCYAIVGRTTSKDLIKTMQVMAEVIDPHYVISKSNLRFRMDVESHQTQYYLVGKLYIFNICTIMLRYNYILSINFL